MNMGAFADQPVTSGEALVVARLPRSPIVFDVGANVGEYARLVLAIRPDARISCFEPSRAAFTELSLRLGGTVTAFPIGLGDREGEADLFAPSSGSPMGSVYPRKHSSIAFKPTERVRVRRLDDVCREMKIEKIHLLKLDVEGHELAVLRGAHQLLASGAVDMIQFEFGGSNIDSRTYLRDFFALFEPAYRIHRVLRDGLLPLIYSELDEVFTTTNYVALRSGRTSRRE
jgi:FkbM family methyltransferase